MSTPPSANDATLERAARAMAEHSGWLQWDSATTCAHTPNGNEPEEERTYWRELAQAAFDAQKGAGAAASDTTPSAAPVETGLFSQMRQALQPKGTAPLVRLFLRDNSFFDAGYVARLVDTAQSRCIVAASGLDELNELERVALQMLCDSAHLKRPGA